MLLLEENRFSGSISSLNLPNLQDFNVFGNRFSGEIQWVTKYFFDKNWLGLFTYFPISKKNIFDNKGFPVDIVFGCQQNNDWVCVLICSYSK